jgi:polysaccharide export outer membrane protein
LLIVAAALTGCSSFGATGPSAGRVIAADRQQVGLADIKVIDVDEGVARRVLAASRPPLFSHLLGEARPLDTLVGTGDALEITLWEAPPAVLFGSVISDPRLSANASLPVGRNLDVPQQVVDSSGRITVPFAGSIRAVGRTTSQIERDIVARLQGRAHLPQAIVRLAGNASANVTVVGEVTNSTRVPLSARGERLLDALAAAGGVKQPIGKTLIQVTRGDRVFALPLDQIIRDPAQNVILQPEDVVTALYRPFSFTALGAVRNNAEIEFEATGLTLSQALGRIGGLDDTRANVRGAFIFRLEDPAALPEAVRRTATLTADGRVPVIYRIDLRNPVTFFAAQTFPVKNKDVIYVSTAPAADLQKFVNIISSVGFSILGLGQAL